MKTLAKGILTTLFLTLTISFVYGQKGVEDGSKYGQGEDSIRCIKNLSLYREYVKQKNYELAISSWKIVYTECPKASLYLYIDGIKMIENAIKKEEDDAQKEILLDSMMKIYDKRIKYFDKKGYVLGNKGVNYIKYSDNTVENMQKGYDFLKESITLEKYKSGPAQLLTFMQASKVLFTANAIEGGQVVSDYGMVSEIVDYVIKNGGKSKANIEKAKPSIDQIFENSGAAQCENLIPLYAKKFEETPEDTEFLEKSTDMLRATKCTESELFFEMAAKLNSLAPTAKLAYELAKLTNKNDKLEDAARYYKQAIELEVEDAQKAKYYLELGDVTRRLGNYSQARTYALNSIELDATSGYPYLLIGNIY
ncbi:MAG: tetratricopeptide repeat protein, partial [Bacteroidales bacterium]|nr:tetratricopeptide repeat protein [Bacteroidales bacterium]